MLRQKVLERWKDFKNKIKKYPQDWKIMITNHQKDLKMKDELIADLQKSIQTGEGNKFLTN